MTRIVAIGDSITWGYPDGYSWTALTAEALDVEIRNMGINGDTLEGMQYRLQEDVIDRKPDLALVMGGSNDVFQGFAPDEIRDIALEIRGRLEENGIRPVFGVPIPILMSDLHAKLEVFREWLRNEAHPVIPFDQAFMNESGIRAGLLPDGVHPTHEGYRLMADVAVAALRKILKGDA